MQFRSQSDSAASGDASRTIETSRRSRTSSQVVVYVGAGVVEALIPRGKQSADLSERRQRVVRFAHDLSLGSELAATIAAKLGAHGVRQSRLVIALGPQFLTSKVIELPSLSGRDLEAVMERRCVAVLKEAKASLSEGEAPAVGGGQATEQGAAYSALAFDPPDAAARRWLVHALHRGSLLEFQMELRSLGLRIDAVVPGRTAPFLSTRCLAPANFRGSPDPVDGTPRATESGARICVLFEETTCCVGLVSDSRLVQLSTLPGSLSTHLTDVQARRSLVQELRGVDAFWRRTSRGERVVEVTIGGAEPHVIEQLAPQIQSALGDVALTSLEEDERAITEEPPAAGVLPANGPAIESTDGHLADRTADGALRVGGLAGIDTDEPAAAGWLDAASSGFDPLGRAQERTRSALLRSLASPRVRALDLSVPLPPRARSIVLTAVASILIFGTLAISMRSSLNAQAASISFRAHVTHTESLDLDELRELQERVVDVEGRILRTCAELEAAGHVGLDADRLTRSVAMCFDRDVAMLSVHAMGSALAGGGGGSSQAEGGRTGGVAAGGGVLRIRGAVIDQPGRTAAALAMLEERLGAIEGVQHVDIDLPSLSDRAGDLLGRGKPSLRFTALAQLNAASAPKASARGAQ